MMDEAPIRDWNLSIDHPEMPLQPVQNQFTVIIPAYNEEAGLRLTLSSLCSHPWLECAEFIVVDDGSTDHTSEILKEFPRVKTIRHPFNRGYGSAIRSGARAAQGEYILWFDSDGQHRVEDLIKVCQKLAGDRLEYCIGVRGENSYHDPSRKLGKWMLKQVVNFSVGEIVPDFNSGLRGFKHDVLCRYLHLLPKGFGASTLTTLLMIEGNHYGATVPIVVQPRQGKSTVRQFRDGFRTLQMILHIVILFKPLKFFGLIGLVSMLAGLAYGLTKAMINGLGFPVLASLLILTGVQSFFFGLLCDQISALRRERFN